MALILLAFSFPLFAETANHDKWLPRGERLDADNIYFGFDGRINLPFIFDRRGNFSGMGLGLGAELGYDLGGWLFGVRYAHLIYGPGETIHGFSHDMLSVELSKLFTKYHIRFFPDWLDMRLMFGFGVDFSGGRYYKTAATQAAKLTSEEHFATMLLSPGIFFEFTGLPLINPYLGANFAFTPDIRGTFFIPTVALGVRTSVGKIKAALPDSEEKVEKEKTEKAKKPKKIKGNKNISVVEEGDNYRITLKNIVFDADAATFEKLTPEQRKSNEEAFDAILKLLQEFPDFKITINGYANNTTGTEEEEAELIPLSKARAEAVMKILIDNGIEGSRIRALGMGGANPLETKKEFSWKNRRVEFLLEKEQGM